MTRRYEVTDEDGNALPPPDPGSDVAQIIYLIEYARTRSFRIGPTVKVGDAVVQVVDLRQAAQEATSTAAPDVEPGSDMATLLGG